MYPELHIHYFPYVLGSSFITIFTWKIKFRESKYFLLSPVGSKAWRWNSDLGLYDSRAEVCAHLVLLIGGKQRCEELNLFIFLYLYFPKYKSCGTTVPHCSSCQSSGRLEPCVWMPWTLSWSLRQLLPGPDSLNVQLIPAHCCQGHHQPYLNTTFFLPWFLIARSLSLPLTVWPTQGWSNLGQTEACVRAHVMWEAAEKGREQNRLTWGAFLNAFMYVQTLAVIWKILIGLQALTN